MNRFTGLQRAFCVRAFYKNNDSYTVVRRHTSPHFNLKSLRHVPSANLIKHWVCKFEETGNTMPDQSSGRKRTSRTSMNVDLCTVCYNSINSSKVGNSVTYFKKNLR
ncbi:hypothetical protein K1T71_014349 [Dendrolimus kikuchii]|uniref:Uncharacterized protein n=1 Tax=Dendrolimus kikuchii TaxID=765133 RepID=A0ACC1CDQ1_9NEOP|nr:hypothetical protein K1T71_014349 [Dendrolimus kikuchii]